MLLSRPQLKIAVVTAVFLAFLLPSAAFAQSAAESTITADGVGKAMLGLSPQELADALGADYDVGDEVRITVDFDGRVITRDGVVQFRAAMTDNTDDLTLFIVSNPEYATAGGVGPTTTIAQAEAIYGDATLAWNPDNEGREFVSFADGPEGRIAFRTPGIGGTNVGIYADGEFETSDYEDGAAIAAVWVSCVSGTDCPADRPAETTPEPTAEPTATPAPTATPEPTPEPTPEATPAPTPAPSTGDGSGASEGELPNTGTTELVLMSLVATLFVMGGALVLMERRYLCPAWLKPNYRR
jgi:LPXTG-motif cell wall-anchored protein